MKKITILFLGATFLISCGKNQTEQMLYDYQQRQVKALNFNLADLDFEIESIEKTADITASDSIKHLKKELAELWQKNPNQSLADTLTFKHVSNVLHNSISQLDTLYEGYQELVLMAIRNNNFSGRIEYKRQRDNALDDKMSYRKTLLKVETLENYYNQLSEKPDSVLAVKYKVNFSQNNPMLGNAKQTFDKVLYTNSTQTEFVKEE